MEFSIKEYKNYNEEEILSLYKSVGWINYTDNPKMLEDAYANSLRILGAYENENSWELLELLVMVIPLYLYRIY